jgi:hypothetical protein
MKKIGWTKLLVLIFLLGTLVPLHAEDSYTEQLRQYKLVYIELLEKKLEKIPTNTTVEVSLKDGTSNKVIFKSYSKYDDALWFHPIDSRWGFLSDDAYDIREIEDVQVIVQHRI